MRKAFRTALIIAVVVLAVVVLVKPSEPSVEDHIEGYYAARRSGTAPTFLDKVAHYWRKARGREIHYGYRMAFHRDALHNLGYLETRTFVVSNRPAGYVHAEAWNAWYSTAQTNTLDSMVKIWDDDGTSVYVVAPKADMPIWESWIRQADVPE